MVRPNRTYSLLKLQAKSFSKIFQILLKFAPKYSTPFINTLCFRHLPRQRTLRNSSKLRKFHAICPHSTRIMRNSHHLLTYYTLCFRHLPWQRTLGNSSELRKFRAIHPHSPRITRNSHHLLTYYTLCFRHLPQQRTLRNSSELRKFRTIRPHSPRITRNSHQLLTYYILCFRCLTSGREPPKIPANQTKFAQFAHIPRELHELHAFRTKFTHI